MERLGSRGDRTPDNKSLFFSERQIALTERKGMEENLSKCLPACLDVVGPQRLEIANVKPPVSNNRIGKRFLGHLPRLFFLGGFGGVKRPFSR
jgi:hypothetical protein